MSGPDAVDLGQVADPIGMQLQPAPTFTATGCPHCEQVFEVQIDFEEVGKDNVEFERMKRKELEAQKEQYKQDISRSQEEVNRLKETLANLCNQLAQHQVDNLRAKQGSVEQDGYIKQLKAHLKESEDELQHLSHDFELALARQRELHNAHLRNTGQLPGQAFSSQTAQRIVGGDPVPGANTGPMGGPAQRAGAPPPAPVTAAPPRQSARQRLTQFYRVHNPAKLHEVDQILREFEGQEEEMFIMLARKYCAAPITASGYHG